MRLFIAFTVFILSFSVFANGIDIENGEFILGFYSADNVNDKNFKLIKETGMNFVHSYGTRGFNERAHKQGQRILDYAEKYDLKVMFDIGGQHWVNPENSEEDKMAMINAFKDHPALGFWYLYDEPKIELIPQLVEIKNQLNKITPKVPTSLVIHWIKEWYKTRVACDLFMVDSYPVRDQEFPHSNLKSHNQYMSSAVNLKNPSKPVIAVLQCYNWDCMKEQLNKGPDAVFRFPNSIEMNNMALSAISMGVRGIFYYSFFHIHIVPNPGPYHPVAKSNMDWYLEVFMPTIKEIKEITNLLHPSWKVDLYNREFNKENDIQMGYWERDSGKYLILCNDTKENREITINLDNLEKIPKNAKLQALGTTRKNAGKIENGKLELISVGPWESFTWKLEE